MDNEHEKMIERSMEIGGKFLSWTPETGPCPISINETHWFKKLCGLFEIQASQEMIINQLLDALSMIEKRGNPITQIAPLGANQDMRNMALEALKKYGTRSR